MIDCIFVISHKSLIVYSELSEVEDNGAFSRLCSYVRHLSPNKEAAGHPAKGLSTGGCVVWWFQGETRGQASWVQLPAETLTQGEQSQVSWLEADRP